MIKKSIESSVKDLMLDIIKSTEYELIDIEYVKEGPFKYLKVYIDKKDGITVDDCADVSRALNKKLDELDLIQEQYFLEVSSPGVERPFKTEEDYQKNIGEFVEVKLYKPLNGKKVFEGILLGLVEDKVEIKTDEGAFMSFDRKDTALVRRIVRI
jgi:ribosome maturation factor RimP